MTLTKEQVVRTLELQIQSLTVLKEQLEVIEQDVAPGLLDASIRRIQDNLIKLQTLLRFANE